MLDSPAPTEVHRVCSSHELHLQLPSSCSVYLIRLNQSAGRGNLRCAASPAPAVLQLHRRVWISATTSLAHSTTCILQLYSAINWSRSRSRLDPCSSIGSRCTMPSTDRAALEGERTSQSLHHWIDLTFGCHLRGPSAMTAKNVELAHLDR